MQSIRGVIYALISSSTFGLIPLFAVPPVLAGMPVNSVVFHRFMIAAVAMGAVLWVKRIDFRISRREFLPLAGLSVLYAATALLLTKSYFYISSGTATTIHFLYPMVVSLIMAFFFKEKASRLLYAAILLAVGGVYLLSGSHGGGGGSSPTGFLLAFTTVLTYASYLVLINRSCISRMDGLKATFWVLFLGMVLFFFNALATDGEICGYLSFRNFADLFLLGTVTTLISDLTLILAVQRIGSTTTAILGCMEPMTAVCTGVLFLGESCSPAQAVGLFIILSAVSLVIYSSRKPAAAPQQIRTTPPGHDSKRHSL